MATKVMRELTRSSAESISDDSMLTESVMSQAAVLAVISTAATVIDAMLAHRINRDAASGVAVRDTGFASTMAPWRRPDGIPAGHAAGTAGPARTRSAAAAGGSPTSAAAAAPCR